ncbi:MAG: hypothetical protein P1U36_01905 [Legionellaceae bacterium]|nr:hypothetical protein [Legionellaceae bacterium]
MTQITISVFQALTLLAEKYCHDTESEKKIFKYIKYIYLTGARTQKEKKILNKLLQDPLLTNFNISATKQAINEDPVRRYFESHLAHNTLATSLDDLDILLLHENFHLIFALINEADRDDFESFLKNVGEQTPHSYVFVDEYLDAIFQLNKPDSYQSLSPKTTCGRLTPEDILEDRKQKLIMITKCMYASAWAVNTQPRHSPRPRPLDIYHSRSTSSPYGTVNRGRKERLNLASPLEYPKQNVRPHTRGIMRSYMPLPREDALFAREPSNYARPADQYTYRENRHLSDSPNSVPRRMFENQVTPFVGSISGVMLMQLKVMALLVRSGDLPFLAESGCPRNTQLELYIKSFVAYMLYNAGGHSLDEFLDILEFSFVEEEFKSLVGFEFIKLKNLFQTTNAAAFNKAMEQTFVYNNNIIQKKRFHTELEEKSDDKNAPFISIEMNIDLDYDYEDYEDKLDYSKPFELSRPEPDNKLTQLTNNPEHHEFSDGTISHLISVSSQSMFHAPAHIPEPPKHTPDEKIRKQFIPASTTGA